MSEGQRVLLVEDLTTDGVQNCPLWMRSGNRRKLCTHGRDFYYDIFPETIKTLQIMVLACITMHMVGCFGRSQGAKCL